MSYEVSRRTNEIGVRTALGAGRSSLLWMVMRESLTLVMIGLVVGLGCRNARCGQSALWPQASRSGNRRGRYVPVTGGRGVCLFCARTTRLAGRSDGGA